MHHPSTKQIGSFGKDSDWSSVTCPVLFSIGWPTVLIGSWCSVTPARWKEILQIELLLPVTSFTIIISVSPCHWTLCNVTARLNKWCGLNRENSATGQFRYCLEVCHPRCVKSNITVYNMYVLIYSVRNTTINRWYHYVIYITVQ